VIGKHAALDAYFADRETEEILRLGSMPPTRLAEQVAKLDAQFPSDIPELDQAKLHILLAEFHLAEGQWARARSHARELMNSPGFENWASRVLEMTSSGKDKPT
jgi:hypothetical protein